MLGRVLRAIAAIASGQAITTLGGILLVPLFLSLWSTPVYGEWMAMSAAAAYLGVTELGMNSAAGNALMSTYARRDMDRYRRLQASALGFYVVLALAMTVLCAAACLLLPIPQWLGIKLIPARTAAAVMCLLAARLLWQMPVGQIGNIYRTLGNCAATQWIGNLHTFSITLATVLVIASHGGVLDVAIWTVCPLVSTVVISWYSLRRRHPEVLPRLSEARLSGLRELLGPSLFFGLMMASSLALFQWPVILVSTTMGGAAVALLVTTRTLVNLLRQAVGTVYSAIWPELTRMDALGATEKLRVGHRLLIAISVVLGAAFSAALWFEGGSVMGVWTRGRIVPDIGLLRCFLVVAVLQIPWLASSMLTTATNRHRRLACSYTASAVVGVIAMMLLRSLGLIAVPLGTGLGEAVACYHFVIKDSCSAIGEPYASFAARLWPAVTVVLITAWCAAFVTHQIAFGPAPLHWILVGVATTLAAGTAAWGAVLRKSDRAVLLRQAHARFAPLQTPQIPVYLTKWASNRANHRK